MTPFRASWSGSPLAAWSSGTHTSRLQTETMTALRELCQGTPACNAQSDAAWAPTKLAEGNMATHGAEASREMTAVDAPLDDKTRAADMIRAAAQTAAQLGLHEGLRWAAAAAALQLRAWDGQSAALLAQAWTVAPSRSRTVSGAGMPEVSSRLSCTGTEQDCKPSMAMPRPAARRLSAQPVVRLRAAVTVVWSVQRWAYQSGARPVLCWPQSTAAANEHARQQWHDLQNYALQKRTANVTDGQLTETTHDDASACVADEDANPISDDPPDEGSGQAESDDTAGRSQQGCAVSLHVFPLPEAAHAARQYDQYLA